MSEKQQSPIDNIPTTDVVRQRIAELAREQAFLRKLLRLAKAAEERKRAASGDAEEATGWPARRTPTDARHTAP